MTRRLPGLVLLATLGVLGGLVIVARKSPAPPPPRPMSRGVEEDVQRLRSLRRAHPELPAGGVGQAAYAKGLDRLRAADAADLRALEDRVLDRREDVLLRVDLLQAVAAPHGEPARRLCGTLASDPEEAPALRLAALSILMTYQDPHTLDLLRSLWESPRPFEGRPHLVAALGECGQPGAIPLLREALGPAQPPEIRSQAALSLGAFVEEPALRDELIRLAAADPLRAVRENALRALARSTAPEVERTLREAPAELRPLAEALLRERAK
jgi:hypothetical protein